jgi:DNA invertase Pin-like site-specific DNA recombinase
MTTRVAIYARVSTSRQETENQVAQLREFSARRGWEVTHVFREKEPGWEPDRQKLAQFLSYAHQRKFDVGLVWALDRFSRQGVGPTLELLRRLQSCGIPLVSYREEFLGQLDPHVGELVTAVLAWTAKQEHIRLSERTKAGLQRARASGKTIGKPRVYTFDERRLARVDSLRRRGVGWRTILRHLGLPDTAVSSLRRAYQKGHPVAPSTGAPAPAGEP